MSHTSPMGRQEGTVSGIERVEHGDTHGTGSVLHTLTQGRAKFSRQRLVTTEIRTQTGSRSGALWHPVDHQAAQGIA